MLTQVSDRCYLLPFDRAGDRPALGFVRGDRFSLRIDAGNSPAHARRMDTALQRAGLPAGDFVVLTHSHWDHTYGLCAMDCPAIACGAAQRQLQVMARWQWTPQAMQRRLATREDIAFCHEAILVEYADPAAIRVRAADLMFEDRLTLDLGGVHADLLKLPNSHAEDCVAIHIPEERVVYLGDICYEDLHHDPVCWHRSRFEALCLALSELEFDTAVMGHQAPLSRAELMQRLHDSLLDGELPVME